MIHERVFLMSKKLFWINVRNTPSLGEDLISQAL